MAYVDSGFDEPRPRRSRPTGFSYPSAGGNTGVSGFGGGGKPVPPVGQDPTTSSAPPKPPTYFGMAGYNPDKLNDLTHTSAKYQIGRTLRGFDPHLGVSSDVLAALNKLGFGTFAGSRDDLSLSGVTDAGRAAGLDPHDFSGDFIQGFHSNNPLWQYDFYKDPQAVQQAAYGPDPMASLLQFAPSLFGPPQMPQPQQQAAPQQPQLPAIFSDPSFWQQMMGAMQPQAQSSMPSFDGAQAGTGRAQAPGMNPQITQLLSQLFAGLTGGR